MEWKTQSMPPARGRLTAPFWPFWASSLAAQSRPRNILFVAVDDLNTDLGCYGHPLVRTPNIDALARRGVRFDRAYCQYPVCNPSRTSLLSGLYPERTGILDNQTNPRARVKSPFLPEYLREKGYFTASIGKIYHDAMAGEKDWDLVKNPRPVGGTGQQGEGRNLTGGKFAFFRWLAAEGSDEDQPDGLIAKEAEEFLRKPPGKPWFLAVGFRKPHDPYIAPKKYFEPYPLEAVTGPAHPRDDESDIPAAAYPPVRHNLGALEGREYRRAYYACISFMDAQLGRVLDALDASGAASNTMIVFFGDHGLHLGEHGWWNKVTLFERSARVPMLAAGPNVAVNGAVCRRAVELVDLYPTFMESLGLPAPGGLQGDSLVPLLRNPDAAWDKPAYTVVMRGGKLGRALHTERYRYTEWDEGRLGVELYDHNWDPNEYHNLASDAQNRPLLRELSAALRRLSTGAAR
jgi:uncharacterized sulfatase